jgi:tripartite-type tricarboxylate transporter receptor subunit TctC
MESDRKDEEKGGAAMGQLATVLLVAAGALVGLWSDGAVQAQSGVYPDKLVTMVVPFPPGGGTDIVARVLAQQFGRSVRQTVIVDNKPGATGGIAATAVKRAKADGYTLLFGTSSTMSVLAAIGRNPPFDSLADFEPITLLGYSPYVLLVHPSVPAKTLPELIEFLRKNPNAYSFSTSGIGSLPHLLGAMLMQKANVSMIHAPFQGSGPATSAALRGEVQVTFDTVAASTAAIKDGRLRALGITSAERSASFPEIPTIGSILPGYEGLSWLGLFAPKRTPTDVIESIRATATQVAQDPDVTTKMQELGVITATNKPAELSKMMQTEMERWREIGRAANINLD